MPSYVNPVDIVKVGVFAVIFIALFNMFLNRVGATDLTV